MSYLVNLRIAGRPVLVVGAGAVAARKVGALLDAGAHVTVVAPEIGVEVAALARAGRIRVVERAFGAQDVEGGFLVVGATDDDSVNRQVAEAAAASGALVNIVDRPELCMYTVPATVRRGHLTLAVATDGRCPTLARAIRERLERQFGPEYGAALDRLAAVRERLMAARLESVRVAERLSGLVAAGFVDAVAAGDEARATALVAAALRDVDAGTDTETHSS